MPTITIPTPTLSFCGAGKQITVQNLDEALKQAELDFTVSQQRNLIIGAGVNFKLDEHDPTIIRLSKESEYNALRFDNQAPIVRDDTKEVLVEMGAGYTILQNHECIGVLEDLIAENSDIKLIHGGQIKNCEKLWISATLPDGIQIGPDFIQKTINIMWSHIGRMKLSINFIPFLDRKGISLNMGTVDSGKHVINIRHTKGGPSRLGEARKAIKKAIDYYAEVHEWFSGLHNSGFNAADMDRFLHLMYPDPKANEETGKQNKGQNHKHRLGIMEIFNGQNDDISFTKWAAFTSLCEYIDTEGRVSQSRKGKDYTSEEMRLHNIWFGTGAKIKGNSFNKLLTL